MTRASRAFVDYVWPAVAHFCGDGELMPVESTTAEGFARELDILAGIDFWQAMRDRGYMRGIAARVQATPRGAFDTFTIREHRDSGARTEFEKRLGSIRQREVGALYPALTVQGYVASWDEGPLLSAAVCRTIDLYEWLADMLATAPAAGRAEPHQQRVVLLSALGRDARRRCRRPGGSVSGGDVMNRSKSS